MERILTAALINNVALLLALSVIYEIGYFLPSKYQRVRPVINGLLIAFICVLIMSVPFTLMPGVVFDTRSILISVTALTFGMVPTAITSIIAIVLRIVQSGTGTLTGIAVIISSALIGLAWRNYIFPKFKDRRWFSIYIMSITVHTVMLACMLFIPYPDNFTVIGQIAIPVLIIYPVAALLLSLLLIRQQEHKQYQEQLKDSEEKYRRLFETMTQGVVYQAADGKIISANPAAERILGLTFEQMKGRTSMDDTWHSLCEDGSILPGSDHPAMIALRTGRKIGPVVISVFQPQINDHVWLSVNAIPLYHSGEIKPYQVYVTIDDVTAERKASQNYKLLFNKMIDAFALHEIICDDKGKPIDYRFLAVNPTFENLVGKKAADIIGKKVLEIFPDTEPSWIEIYGRVALTGEPVVFNDYSISIDKHFSVSAYQPAPNQFACTFSDITKRIKAETEAAKNLSRLKALLDYSQSPIVIIDDKGKFIEVSETVTKMLNRSGDEIYGNTVSQLLPPEMFKSAYDFLIQPINHNRVFENIDVFDIEGKKRYFESRIFPINVSDKQDKLLGYIGIDVTERLEAEEALKESEEKYSSYIENAPIGIYVVNNNGQYIEVNHAAQTISGYSREELLKMNINDITADESKNEAMRNFMLLKENGSMSAVLQYKHKNGSNRWWVINAVKLSDNRFLGFSSDITDRKKTEDDLVYLINHDYLTGLYNRKYFEEAKTRLDKDEYLPLSVLIADINGVRFINDSFGYAEGDKLIDDTSDILKSCCRPDDVLARIGGDEFAMLLPNTDSGTAYEILKKINSKCEMFNDNSKAKLYEINMSIGFGTKENSNEDIGDITKTADVYLRNKKLLNSKSFRSDLISSMMTTVYEKSQETEEHAVRLADLCRRIGEKLNLSHKSLGELELLTMLHDIGKIVIDDSILKKPGKLTDDEWIIMKSHTETGYRIAKSTSELEPIAEYILAHHERWDGKGYPYGLAGDSIPLLSRIVSIADAYDAMTNDRVYRKAMTSEEAVLQIKLNAGTQFDPQITAVFETIINDPEYNQKSGRDIK